MTQARRQYGRRKLKSSGCWLTLMSYVGRSPSKPADGRGAPAQTGYPPNIMLAKWHEMEIVCTKAQIKQILINHYR